MELFLRGSSDLTGYAVVKGVSPREGRGSLMMFGGRGMVQCHVVGRVVMATVVVVVVRVRVVVVVLSRLCRLSLRVLLVLHSSVLEPYLHLPFRQIEVTR